MIDLQNVTRAPKAPPMPRDPNWLKVSEVAALLQVSPATVWRLQRDGRLDSIKTYKPASTVYYWRPDVLDYIRAATHGDTPPAE